MLGALAALACTTLAACGSGSSMAKLPPLHPGRVGPSTMFTPASEIVTNPTGTLNELRRLGVNTVHLYLHWADVAPDPTSQRRPNFNATDPAAYPAAGWTVFDTIVREVKARGMKLDVALVPPPPAWASGRGAPDPPTQPEWRPSAPEYGQFVRAVGTRYSGHYAPPGQSTPLPRVNFWSIWNEPNLGTELAPQAVPHTQIELSGSLYRGLLDSGWSALHATGHGSDTILIGEIAPAGATFGDAPGQFAAMAPLRFLRALYCVDASYHPLRGAAASERGCPTTQAGTVAFAGQHPALFHASGFADHPYPQGLPPNEPTPQEADYAELADLPQLEHTLDALQRVYGSKTSFPIYSTEFGYQTTPPDPEAGTVSPAQAAGYLNWSEYITWLNPRLKTYDQYLLIDSPRGNFASALRYATGVPKPGYAAFRMPIYLPVRATGRGHPLEVWGCVRPARFAQLATGRQQSVRIQFASSSGGRFTTQETVPIADPHGYFDLDVRFLNSGVVRLAWTYPHGPEVFSRTVAIQLR